MRLAALVLLGSSTLASIDAARVTALPAWAVSPAAAPLTLPLHLTGWIAVRAGGDLDADGTLDMLDNCPLTFNPDQYDVDGDGLGDPCDAQVDPRLWLRSAPARRPLPRPAR
jgi:hypothetical protein